eukprot:TRINITY_DN30006_c0_g1_i1.p1 TRINITY_DN30006_c0_g1~~TRINITY_DN30006_c0_g1_i1.p1  ORF type:complete len:429 (-),score=47.02 TRINITY_DN30006_c0_g1_i1:384-1670(-)
MPHSATFDIDNYGAIPHEFTENSEFWELTESTTPVSLPHHNITAATVPAAAGHFNVACFPTPGTYRDSPGHPRRGDLPSISSTPPQNELACHSRGSTVRQIHSRTSSVSGQSQCSFLFDVSAKTYVTICAISFVPGTHEGDYEIWTTPEMHERVHQSQKYWTLVAKGQHVGPRGAKHRVLLHRHVTIPAGERHGFYIAGHNANAVCFSTDTHGSNSGENDDVVLHLGHFKSYPWESQLSTGPFGHNGMQEFVGSLEYQVLQSHAVDHAVATAEQLWHRRLFPDAQVVAPDGKTFAVHRAVLAAASPVLEAAWRQPLREGEERILHIEAEADAVEALLRFMYTGQDSITSDPGEMLRLAHLYGLPALVRSSAFRLADQVSAANAVNSVRALRSYRDDGTVAAAWHMLLANIQGILAGDAMLLEKVLLSV